MPDIIIEPTLIEVLIRSSKDLVVQSDTAYIPTSSCKYHQIIIGKDKGVSRCIYERNRTRKFPLSLLRLIIIVFHS